MFQIQLEGAQTFKKCFAVQECILTVDTHGPTVTGALAAIHQTLRTSRFAMPETSTTNCLDAITMSQVKAAFTAFPQAWSEHIECDKYWHECQTYQSEQIASPSNTRYIHASSPVLLQELLTINSKHGMLFANLSSLLVPHDFLPFLCLTDASTILSFNVLVTVTDPRP